MAKQQPLFASHEGPDIEGWRRFSRYALSGHDYQRDLRTNRNRPHRLGAL